MRPLHNRRRGNPRASQRRPAPLRAVEPLEARELPAISITNLALSGGPVSEATPSVRTLTGTLSVPPISAVDLAITWGDGSAVQHVSVASGGRNFSANHLFNFTGDNPSNSASYPFTVSVAARYAQSQVVAGPSAASYVAATVPFLAYNLQAGQAGVIELGGHGSDTFVGLNLGADSFRFMGAPRTGRIYVGSDGYITFGSGNTTAAYDSMSDSSALTQAALAPLWAGWRITHSSHLLARALDLDHDGHNDWLLIQWDNVKQVHGNGRATFQAALQLNSGANDGDVWFNYVSNGTTPPTGTSVGVKNSDHAPANALVVSHSLTDPRVATGHALLVSRSATTTTTVTGTVVNVPPKLTSLALNRSTLDEGSAVNLSGQFSDPGPLDTFTVSINWGDGQTQTVSRDVGAHDFGPIGHTYLDNGVYPVSVSVTDDDGGKSNTLSLPVTVNNVAPALSNLSLDTAVVDEGGTVTLGGRITDPGVLDTFTVQVDWGDGTTSQQNYGAGAPLNFSMQHTYTDADASPAGLMNVRVRVKDKDMVSFGNYQPVGAVQVNNVPPTIAGLAVTSPVNEGDVATLTGSVVDPSPGDTFTLTVSWGDGTADTFTPQAGAVNYSHRYLNNPAGAPTGSYSLVVNLLDDDGGQFIGNTQVTVNDVAPSHLALAAAPVNENSAATLTGTFADPGILDSHAVTVAWGDGATDTFALAAGVTSFNATHVYLDEAPAATGYRVTVTVADDDGLTTSRQTDLPVNNVAPSNLQLGMSPAAIDENGTTALAGSFADPGTLDTHVVSVAWGDGATETFALAAGVTSFSGRTHQYLDDNANSQYVVTVTVADDDGGTAGATTAVLVSNVAPSNLQLTVSPAAVDENGSVSLGGTFADPGTLDPHSVVVAWGDGATDSFALAAGVTSFSGKTHQYLDDNPNGPYTVTVTVADNCGGTTSGTTAVQVNNVAPSNLVLTASPASANEGAPVTLGGTFSDPGTLDTHAVAVTWGDGGSDTFALAAGVTSFSIAHVYQDEAPVATGYHVTVAVTDNGGLGTTGQTDVPVNNVAPSNLQLSASPAAVNENGTTALAGTFTDPDALDSHVVTVAWGDGATDSFALAAGVTSFSGRTHQYLDDNASGPYTVNVSVADDDGGTTNGTTAVQVNNVAPTITSLSATPAAINEGQAVTLTGSFTDPGSLDTFAASVNWGDGATGTVAVSGHSFSATHVYDDGASPSSSFTVGVAVSDNGGGSASGSTNVSVADVAPTATFASTGPYVAGVPITIRFSNAFDPSAADTAAGFKYSYDFNNDGVFDIVNSSSPTATHAFPSAGSYTLKGRITDKDGGFTDLTTNVTIGPAGIIAVGANAGSTPRVQVFDAVTGALKFDFLAYDPAFSGGVRVAVADVTGDGVPDIITAAGSTAPHVEVWDGVTGNLDFSFFAFNVFVVPTGVTVAAGDFNGDGKADLVIGTNLGGGGQVELLDGSKLGQVQPNGQIAAPAIMRVFSPYPGFGGEIRVAAGDVTGDGVPDIITGAGPFGGPHVQVFNGVTGAVVYSFMAFDGSYTGGVYVAAGDLDGDGHADLIVSQGSGFQAQVHTYSGATGLLTGTATPFADLAPLPNGVTVAAVDRDGDGKAEILVANGSSGTPIVRTLNGTTLAQSSQFQPFDPSFLGGVFVG